MDGRDVQLEEIRAVYFSKWREQRKQEPVQQLAEPMNLTKSATVSMDNVRLLPLTHSTLKRTYSDSNLPQDQSWCLKTDFIPPVEKPRVVEMPVATLQKSSHVLTSDISVKDQSWYLKTDFIEPVKMGQSSEMVTTRMIPAESIVSQNKLEILASKENVETGCADKDKVHVEQHY